MKRLIILTVVFLVSVINGISSDTLHLSLNNVISMAIMQSPSVKYAQNKNVNNYWRYKNFKSSNMPRLTAWGDVPDYKRTTDAVTQPDGSVKFIPTELGRMRVGVNLSQSIATTGTQIYASSNVYRIQNYRDKELEFSGEPFKIGFTQPVYSYNWLKWQKKTEPLVYEEAQKKFIETLEIISYRATVIYFNYLKVKTNFILAENNLVNSEGNLRIAEAKMKLGRISENDYSRIKLSVLNARKALNTANMALKNADFELKSYVGLDQNKAINLDIPLDMRLFVIDVAEGSN